MAQIVLFCQVLSPRFLDPQNWLSTMSDRVYPPSLEHNILSTDRFSKWKFALQSDMQYQYRLWILHLLKISNVCFANYYLFSAVLRWTDEFLSWYVTLSMRSINFILNFRLWNIQTKGQYFLKKSYKEKFPPPR